MILLNATEHFSKRLDTMLRDGSGYKPNKVLVLDLCEEKKIGHEIDPQ